MPFILKRIKATIFGVFYNGVEITRGTYDDCRSAMARCFEHSQEQVVPQVESDDDYDHGQYLAEIAAERATERYFEERNWTGHDPRGW